MVCICILYLGYNLRHLSLLLFLPCSPALVCLLCESAFGESVVCMWYFGVGIWYFGAYLGHSLHHISFPSFPSFPQLLLSAAGFQLQTGSFSIKIHFAHILKNTENIQNTECTETVT